jgi:hypothetical protein
MHCRGKTNLLWQSMLVKPSYENITKSLACGILSSVGGQ